MARPKSTKPTTSTSRPADTKKMLGLGFLQNQAKHGFLIEIPKGSVRNDMVRISEFRNLESHHLESVTDSNLTNHAPSLRVLIDRNRWLELAPTFWEEANRRLRSNGLPTCKFQKNSAKPIPIHPSLGKELCLLCWAVETAPPDSIPNALLNWEALAPEERWWLYTMTVATTGQAMQQGVGWRRALRYALAENQFIKGEGLPPRARKDMLSHSQLTLDF